MAFFGTIGHWYDLLDKEDMNALRMMGTLTTMFTELCNESKLNSLKLLDLREKDRPWQTKINDTKLWEMRYP